MGFLRYLRIILSVIIVTLCLEANLVQCQSNELLDAVHRFLDKHSENGTNLDDWVPPEEMSKGYVYYHSGFDDEKRPIWIAEWGKWDVKRLFDAGGEELKNYERYTDQFVLRILQSVLKVRTAENPVAEVVLIIDCEGLVVEQLSSTSAIVYHLRKLANSLAIVRGIGKGYILNTTYLVELVVNLVKPIAGNILNNFEFYGTNKAKWIPKLLKEIPKSQLPPWYGGTKDFKPISVYGR